MYPETMAERLANLCHQGALHGSTVSAEASRAGRHFVQVGLWIDGERIRRARFMASDCEALNAYADLACQLIEAGVPIEAIDVRRLCRHLPGFDPVDETCAELVVEAFRSALLTRPLEVARNECRLRVLPAKLLEKL